MSGVVAAPVVAVARRRERMPVTVMLALGLIGAMLFVAVFADWLAPYDFIRQDLAHRLRPPVWEPRGLPQYLLGTDNLGRDILSRLIYGIRTSILIAVLGTAIGALLGTLLGFVAAHLRGWADEVIMMLVDVQAAVPFLIVALAVLAFFGNSFVLFVVLVGLDGWERYARLARSLVLGAKEAGYAVAMRGLGAPAWRLYLIHVLPNVVSALVVQATLNFPGTILLETGLSFLGLGVQPPMTSLGLMLGQGRTYLLNAWWIAVFPGIAIFATTLSMCLFGDWLRDRLDPTLEN